MHQSLLITIVMSSRSNLLMPVYNSQIYEKNLISKQKRPWFWPFLQPSTVNAVCYYLFQMTTRSAGAR